MTPDVFLSQHGIRTDGISGLTLNSDPAVYVASLQFLNGLRTIDPDTGKLVATIYQTPGYAPGSVGPADFSPALINALNRAMDTYRNAFKTGDLAQVHAAQDAVNMLRMSAGYGPMLWLTDFEIVAESAKNAAGEMARFIISERASVDSTGVGSMVGSPLPWFDTPAAYSALQSYQPAAFTNAVKVG
jgi:hypothetical protein